MGRATDAGEALAAFSKALFREHGWNGYIHLSCQRLDEGQYRIFRFLENGVDLMERADVEVAESSLPIHVGGFLGEVIKTPEPKLIHDMNLHGDPVLGDKLSEYASAAAIPMVYSVLGMQWIVLFDKAPGGFTVASLEDALVQSNMVGVNVGSIVMGQRLLEAQKRIDREVDEIAAIQRSLLPEVMPDIPGLSIAAGYETFDRAGGDYYDLRPLRKLGGNFDPNGPWAIIIADATGHGPAAAVVVAMLHALFHSIDHEPAGPVEFAEHLNANLQSNRIRHAFVTAFLGIYDPPTRTLRYIRAGHEAPLVMEAGGSGGLRRLDDVNGFPLGVQDRVGSAAGCVVLGHGETLVIYTDGITEARSPTGEMFRIDGIERALRECNGQPECVVLEVQEALKMHESGIRASDDQAIVALHVVVPA